MLYICDFVIPAWEFTCAETFYLSVLVLIVHIQNEIEYKETFVRYISHEIR